MDIVLKKYTEEAFVNNYTTQKNIKNIYVEEPIANFSIQHIPQTDDVLFENCIIKAITIGNYHPNSILRFHNCIIENLNLTLSIANCKLVEIIDCTINFLSSSAGLSHVTILRNKNIPNSNFMLPDGLKYNPIKTIEWNLDIKQAGHCKLKEIQNGNILSIQNRDKNISSSIILDNVNFESLNIDGTDNLTIQNNSSITNSRVSSKTIITYSNSNGDSIILNSSPSTLQITDSTFSKVILLHRISYFVISGSKIKALLGGDQELAFPFSQYLTNFKIESTTKNRSAIGNFIIASQPHLIEIKHSDLNILSILNTNFDNNNCNFKLEDVSIEMFKVVNSEIDNVKFSRIHFKDSPQAITIQNSLITKANFHAIQWTSNYKINEDRQDYSDLSEKEFLWNIREAYRQLKVISIESHNKINANRFQQHEVRLYYKYIKHLTWFSKSPTNWWNNLGDWFVLVTNNIFSKFGQSWIIPLVWLIVIHSILVILALPEFNLKFDPYNISDSEMNKVGIELFFRTLSPIHSSDLKIKSLGENIFSIGAKIDFAMRLLSSYFIFYIIRGTRKFHFSV